MKKEEYKYLGKINNSASLKELSLEESIELCTEIRRELIYRVEENGGHLASNLGAVELTVAIHRAFDLPDDKLIFDVGHQSYIHKMLTGRFDRFDTLRNSGGLTGFENRFESEFDFFGAGHAGTSLSAALGFAESEKINGGNRWAVAVIGDGAYTCGMIQEALNNCSPDLRLVILLNENEMSISKNIGGFAQYIAGIRSSKKYYQVKRGTRSFIEKIPLVGKETANAIGNIKKVFKNRLYSSNIFEDMGITYLGPCDGNDLEVTERLLSEAKESNKCCILHVKTQKGKGYSPAEKNPSYYHGLPPKGSPAVPTFSEHFGKSICDAARSDKKICAITAAMADGTGLVPFSKEFPNRFFDVGIAEEHGAAFAAGLCAAGMKPIFAVYSTFMQRSYDNLIHDVSLQELPVIFCLDRAGFAEKDGPTHHGIFDVSMAMAVPGTVIYSPLDFAGFDKAFTAALSEKRPVIIRYKSGGETKLDGFEERYDYIRTNFTQPKKNLIVTYGKVSAEAVKALEYKEIDCENTGIVILEMLKGDISLCEKIAALCSEGEGRIVFVEEGMRSGGAGMNIISQLRDIPSLSNKQFLLLAVDSFGRSECGKTLFQSCGISAEHIAKCFE